MLASLSQQKLSAEVNALVYCFNIHMYTGEYITINMYSISVVNTREVEKTSESVFKHQSTLLLVAAILMFVQDKKKK